MREFNGYETVLFSKSSKQPEVESIVLAGGTKIKILLANFTTAPQRVKFNGLSGPFMVRNLTDKLVRKISKREIELSGCQIIILEK
jgi:hypothetical protein